MAALRAKIAEAELQHDRCARERAYQEEQITALERRSAELEAEIEALRSRLAEVEAERLALAQDEEQVRATSEELTAALAEAERAYAASMNEVAAAEARIEAARADLLTHTAVAERLFEIGRQLEASLERLAQQAEGLIHEQARASAAHLAAKSEAEKVEREVAAAKGRLGELRAEREEVARSLAEARALAHEAATRTRDLRERHARVQHRLDTLTELDARRALYSETVQRIFASDQARREFHFIGTLADALRVEPQWEQAVEAVLGPYLQAVIVPTPEDAVRASKWLRENDAGRALFLVAGLRGASLEGDEAASATVVAETLGLGALLGVSPELRATLERALAREMQTRIADDIEQAVALSLETQAPYVTPEGDWVCGGTLLSAGVERQTGESLLAFKREMRELEARAARLSEEVKAAELAEREAQVRVGELEEKSKQLDEAIGRAERELVALEMNAAQWAQEIARTERHMRVVADDLERLLEERRDLEARRTKTARDAEAAEQARARAAQEVAAATDELAAVRRVAEEENARLSERRAVVAAVGERRRALSADLRRRENEIADLRARLERHDGELAEAQAKLEALRRSVLDLAQSVETIERERAAHARAVEEAGEKLAAARAHADRLTASLAELNRKAAAARDARAALEVQRAEVAARLNYLRESCVAELGQSLEEISAVEIEDGFDLEVARARVEELRARLENFGAVNMMALEELSEAEARLQFLTSQRQDILDGIASTEEALREIRRRSRERFREAFAEINRHFGELFVELFGGGHGEMNLIDADDPLESGIDIIAQPPGKRLQNVLLLSGGEKAMVALALLLAIFRYRPSPFCLLDEVDAPLDEANIGRFTEKIVEMSADTQFIVITHNKRTMEAARALYGVTMEEAGVSKVVSVRFA